MSSTEKSLETEGFQVGISTTLQKLVSGVGYNSMFAYNHIYENKDEASITQNACDLMNNAPLSGLISYKSGQDCYDTLFELQAVLPAKLNPKIIGCPNTVHIEPEQLAVAPYLHVAITIKDPSTGQTYILDPTKWILEPLPLRVGSRCIAEDGNVFTITTVSDSTFIIDEYKVAKDRHDTLIYQYVPEGFDPEQNYRGFLRIKQRYNCITSPVRNKKTPYYLKYISDSSHFDANLPSGKQTLYYEDIAHHSDELEEVFEQHNIGERIQRCMEIIRLLPSGFWL